MVKRDLSERTWYEFDLELIPLIISNLAKFDYPVASDFLLISPNLVVAAQRLNEVRWCIVWNGEVRSSDVHCELNTLLCLAIREGTD